MSAREREIVVCIVKGMTNKQIADALCISTHTVITHRRNIVAKLSIHSPGRAYDLRHCQQTGRSLGHPGYDRRNITVMAHEHHHHDHTVTSLNKAFILGIALNVAFVVVEFAVGLYYGSMGLLSDAGHNLSDVASLLLAMLAFRLAQAMLRPGIHMVIRRARCSFRCSTP